MVFAKKSLGQHFLKSERALSAIVDAGGPTGNDLVLEIGPGQGVLTERLMRFAGKVIAIEKDDFLFEELKEKYAREIEAGKLDLIHGDILDFDPNVLRFYKDLEFKIIANIPYNITGAILEKFLTAEYQPETIVLLVQDEVAKRIVARDGKESILSISVRAYGKPLYIDKVLAGSFVPAPTVDSAIIAIEGISKDFFHNFNEKAFFQLLKAGFQSKRKKLSSNLSNIVPKERVLSAFEALGLDENARAEEISSETWQKLAEILLNKDF
jgi:16S rRNA (adenine1518-N6/adenine1519-N6)-dimethyltransferase